MCIDCGCSEATETKILNLQTGKSEKISFDEHTHTLPNGDMITHTHDRHQPDLLHPQSNGSIVSLQEHILKKNDRHAEDNRNWLQERKILALNLVSSPGAGKTTLLTRTIADLQSKIPISVIEGDLKTANDAERIKTTGCAAIQINTETGCHLEATTVKQALHALNPADNSIVAIENVGNLVCPAMFDLGEKAKVLILSITEGEDKPIKYPHIFRASQVAIINKIDLLPYIEFDLDRCVNYARQVNPNIQIFQVSALTGKGLADWYEWLAQTRP